MAVSSIFSSMAVRGTSLAESRYAPNLDFNPVNTKFNCACTENYSKTVVSKFIASQVDPDLILIFIF